MMPRQGANDGCRECVHFDNGAAAVEAALPGLKSLGSAHAAVRAEDGICALHARYVAASSTCGASRRRASLTPERSPSAKCDP